MNDGQTHVPNWEFMSTADQFSTAIRAKIEKAATEFLSDPASEPWLPYSHGYVYALLVRSFTQAFGEIPPSYIAVIEMSAWAVGERIQQLRAEAS